MSQTTITGLTNRYADWLDRVVAAADDANLSDEARGIVTGAMLRDAWRKHETPEYFVKKIAEYASV